LTTSHLNLAPATGERVRFFPRQLLTAEDLEAEQHYHRQRLRDHNRYLHGWGVVCGCDVQPGPAGSSPWEVRICPGYVLTPEGDEIRIDAPLSFDVASCVLSSEDPCAFSRPCPPIGRTVRQTGKVYLAVRHVDCQSRPVRIAPAGCSCDDAQCEYSRVRDGYELCCLATMPASHSGPRPGCEALFEPHGVLPCPAPAIEPWVVLATITLPAAETAPITQIDLETDRRLLYPAWMLERMARCAAPYLGGTWHAIESDVYHDNPRCTTGNNIEPANVRAGTGGRRRCEECSRLDA
jgi:hypothetical protein